MASGASADEATEPLVMGSPGEGELGFNARIEREKAERLSRIRDKLFKWIISFFAVQGVFLNGVLSATKLHCRDWTLLTISGAASSFFVLAIAVQLYDHYQQYQRAHRATPYNENTDEYDWFVDMWPDLYRDWCIRAFHVFTLLALIFFSVIFYVSFYSVIYSCRNPTALILL